jgi:hypothetical protein
VACRILADDREVYNNANLRQDGNPVPLKVEVAGAKQLVLEIDFGESQDIGDRVVWAGARVFRTSESKQVATSESRGPEQKSN